MTTPAAHPSPSPSPGPGPVPGRGPTAERRLYREPEEQKVTGVCAGLGDYLGVDPTIVRLAVVLLALTTWFGFGFYIVAAVIVPKRPADRPRVRAPQLMPESATVPVILGLLVLSAVALGTERPWFNWPLLGFALLGVGVWLLVSGREDGVGSTSALGAAAGSGDGPESLDPVPENPTTGSGGSTTLTGEVEPPPGPSLVSTDHDDLATRVMPSVPDGAPSADPQGEVPPPVPPWGLGSPTRAGDGSRPLVPPPVSPADVRGRRSGTLALAFVLVGLGLVALVQLAGLADPAFDTTVAGGLLVIGATMVVGAFRGRGRWLALLGFPLIGLLLLDDLATVPLGAGIGDRDVVVADDGHHTPDHDLTIGSLTLDLRDVEGTRSDPTLVEATVGIGELRVLVPDDMTARVDATAGAGDVNAPGITDNGDGEVDLHREFVLEAADETPEGEGRWVELDLRVDVGEVEVVRD